MWDRPRSSRGCSSGAEGALAPGWHPAITGHHPCRVMPGHRSLDTVGRVTSDSRRRTACPGWTGLGTKGLGMSFWDVIWFIIISFAFIAYLMVMFAIITDLFRDRD